MDFMTFFVNVGQNLAKGIKPPTKNFDVKNFLGKCNSQSMFLTGVEENEIINMGGNWKNKKSTGFDNIDMIIVKM